MRIKIESKHARSYVSRDRLVGEVEDLLNSLFGENASRINWIDVPLMDETKTSGTVRWSAAIFLPSDYTWAVRAIAERGFHVSN